MFNVVLSWGLFLFIVGPFIVHAPRPFANYTPTTGTQLQADVNSAMLGDTITLDHTLTYTLTNGLNLPSKTGCTGTTFITILSDDLASLPAGVRVSPSDASHMPTLKTTDVSGGKGIVFNGGCYKLLGLHVTNDVGTTANAVTNIFYDFGLANFNTVDRNYVHPKECPNTSPPYHSTGRFVFADSGNNNSITNNYAACFFGIPYGQSAGATAWDSNGVSMGQGGPRLIDNNYFETWFNGLFFGGSDPTATSTATISSGNLTSATLSNTTGLSVGMPIAIPLVWGADHCERVISSPCWGNGTVTGISGNVVTYTALIGTDQGKASGRITIPIGTLVDTSTAAQWNGARLHDVTVTRNHFHQPTDFATWQFINNGNHTKGYMEIKTLEDSTIDGNYCDGFYSTIGIAAANQSGGGVWTKVSNVTIRNNWLNGISQPLYLTIADPYYLNTLGTNIVVSNNLYTKPDINGAFSGVIPQFFGGQGGLAITLNHNTYYAGDDYTAKWSAWTSVAPYFTPPVPTSFTLTNNIIGNGNYGFTCDSGGTSACWPSLTETKNLFALNINPPNQNSVTQQGFSNSLSIANYNAVQFANKGGSALNDWRLLASSPGYRTASDGTDIGVNISALAVACPDCVSAGSISSARIYGKATISGKFGLGTR